MRWSKTTDWENLAREGPERAELIDWIGHSDITAQIAPFMSQDFFPHTLISGIPGSGKSRLAQWIVAKRNLPVTKLWAPIKARDMPSYGAVIIDEAHLLQKPEWLFPWLEKPEQLVIAVTKRPDKLDDALRRRFTLRLHIGKYAIGDMHDMVRFYGPDGLTNELVDLYAKASAGNPDQCVRIMNTAKALQTLDPEPVLSSIKINADGFEEDQLRYMKLLASMSRPVGVGYIAERLYMGDDTVKRIEADLIDHDLVDLGMRGRELTARGVQYVKQLDKDE